VIFLTSNHNRNFNRSHSGTVDFGRLGDDRHNLDARVGFM